MPPVERNDPPVELALVRRSQVVLVMDLVESVRLMEAHEPAVVELLRSFVRHAQVEVLPAHGGRLVKSTGDGIMAEFSAVAPAAAAARQLHRYFDGFNSGVPPEQQMYMRAGLNVTHLYADDLDIYGSGVNLAARVSALAGPGETVGTAAARDGLVDGLDVRIEDLGDCYVKHVAAPLRVYRIGEPGPQPYLTSLDETDRTLRQAIAVVPFASRNLGAERFAIGDLIAEGVIAQLARTPDMRVLSRMSTAAFRERPAAGQEIRAWLDADYVLGGSYVVHDEKVLITATVSSTDDDQVLWSDQIQGALGDLLQANSELCHQIAETTHQALLDAPALQALTRPMPTLTSHTLMLAGVNLMHRSTVADFAASRRALDALVDRHPRAPASRAWLAKWYVLNATRGLATDRARDAQEALGHTGRALDIEPSNSLALAMEGFVYLHLKKDVTLAHARLDAALAANPNDPLAWLFRSVACSISGSTAEALGAAQRALALSPLDPLRYYYEALAASSALSAGQYARAIELSESSLRRNRTHAPTLRTLIAALVAIGQEPKARLIAAELMRLSPEFTVGAFREQSASAGFAFGKRIADAMLIAGVPLNGKTQSRRFRIYTGASAARGQG